MHRESIPEQIYKALRTGIIEGTWGPGSELRQETLAQQFGVSRVPLREALNQLQAEGLITFRPRYGFCVAKLDIGEIIELFELRLMLEQHAMEVATRNRTDADVKGVEAILSKLSKLNSTKKDAMSAWFNHNRDFHNQLIASSGRERLSSVLLNLRDSVEPYVRLAVPSATELLTINEQHAKLFRAFRDGKAQQAGDIARQHTLDTMKRVTNVMRLREGPSIQGGNKTDLSR